LNVDAPPELAFKHIEKIGGDTGWYACNWLWLVRGFIDLVEGGVGMRRGRPSTTTLRVGDTVDSFRVEAIEPNRRLRLKSEMNLPGRAWLEFEVAGSGSSTTIRQTAIFDPVGLTGQIYWYSLYVPHEFVFSGMIRGIAQAALREMKDLDVDRDGGVLMKHNKLLLSGIGLIALLGASPLQADPIDSGRHPRPEVTQSVHEAEHDVDQAWEVYHRAALGGTVASPSIQADIEQHLHEARTLVAQAQEAADRGDEFQVQRLVSQVRVHTAKAIEGSKEQKK
jgi:hypothetical protein